MGPREYKLIGGAITAVIFYIVISRMFVGMDFGGEVLNVIDGNTIEIKDGSSSVQVHLYGIACPELTQTYGPEAKKAVEEMVLHKPVHCRAFDKDEQGIRTAVVTVTGADGFNLNRELVQRGAAWWNKAKAPNEKQLYIAFTMAQESQQGLWAWENPTPPWDFKKGEPDHAKKPQWMMGR